MSTDLKKYLLSGAKGTPYARTQPQEGSNLALALRRHAHAVQKSNSKNRLSLNLEDKYRNEPKVHQQAPIRYRGAASDLAKSSANRRSLDFDSLSSLGVGRSHTTTFELPNSSSYSKLLHEDEDRAARSRRRRREETLSRDDSMDPAGEEHSGASAQLTKLADMTPKSYNEAQRMKKMLKRAVSGPNATFEDLKLYRTAMRKLRRIVKEEQEKEIEMANEDVQIKRNQEKLNSTSNYGTGRYGSSGSVGSSYLSVLNRDRSASRDGYGSGYGSDYAKSGYSSGTGSRPYSSRYGSSTYGSKGIGDLASKFGGTLSSKKTEVTSPSINSSSPSYRTREPTTNTFTSSKSDTLTTATEQPRRRVRDSTNSEMNSNASRVRTREKTKSSTFESPSTYTPRYSRLSSYDKSEIKTPDRYISGYISDTKSGYGSDYKSGYNSSSNYPKYQSYSRSNSTLKNDSYKPYSRESSYKPFSRENSYLSSDTAGGSSWRSKVYGTDNKTVFGKSENTVNDLESKKTSDTGVIRGAIDKLTKAANDDIVKNRIPEGVSPNAIRVFPPNFESECSKNKAPADFTSASEDSDEEENNKKITTPPRRRTRTEEKINEVEEKPAVSRPFRHLAAVAPLPTISPTSTGLATTPTFKLSSRYATSNSENMPISGSTHSKWLREKEDRTEPDNLKSPSPISNKDAANKDYRKSILNMDIKPAETEVMRKQQEEKREELRRQRKQMGSDNGISNLSGKPPTANPDTCSGRLRPTKLDIKSVNSVAEEIDSCEDESKTEKPPIAPSIDKIARNKVIERKHSKGKSDNLRRNGSFRRTRERRTSQTGKSTSDSSDSDSESCINRSRNGSFSGRRNRSKDELRVSEESRPGYRLKTESQSGRRSRNNSESLSKNNSKSKVDSKSEEKYKESSSIDNEIVVTNYTFTLGNKKAVQQNENPVIPRTKATINDSESSSSSISSKSSDSSDSAGEEGTLFSVSRSKSSTNANSIMPPENEKITTYDSLGLRTSPDGKENPSLNNSSTNINSCAFVNAHESPSIANITLPMPEQNCYQNTSSKTDLNFGTLDADKLNESNLQSIISTNLKNLDGYEQFEWPTGSPELPRKKIEAAIAENNNYEEFRWPSKSPELPRKTVPINDNEKIIQSEQSDQAEVYDEFQWPDGSPELPRKRNVLKPQWDTETETEMTEMEQTEWEDGSPISRRRNMPQVAEETEDEFKFEWASSPEMSRRHPLLTQYSGYDTQNEMESFQWNNGTESPTSKNTNFVTRTMNIDELLEETKKMQDDFNQLEKFYGFDEKTEAETKLSEQTSECSEAIMNGEDTDDNKEDEENSDIPTEEECEIKDNTTLLKGEDISNSKESLKERARSNLSVFLGKLSNIDDIVSAVLKPLTNLPATIKKKTSSRSKLPRGDEDSSRPDTDEDQQDDNDTSMEEIDASDVKVHDAQENRAEILPQIEEIDISAVIIRETEKREALKAEITEAVKQGVSTGSFRRTCCVL